MRNKPVVAVVIELLSYMYIFTVPASVVPRGKFNNYSNSRYFSIIKPAVAVVIELP